MWFKEYLWSMWSLHFIYKICQAIEVKAYNNIWAALPVEPNGWGPTVLSLYKGKDLVPQILGPQILGPKFLDLYDLEKEWKTYNFLGSFFAAF